MHTQDSKPISSRLFSFREKLSFVTNSDIYKKLPYKLWTICKLLFSCVKCALPITDQSCNDIISL